MNAPCWLLLLVNLLTTFSTNSHRKPITYASFVRSIKYSMRCKKHPCDLSSSAGVCASCLRERLLALIAAQAQVQQAQAQQHEQLARAHSRASAVDHSRSSDAQPQPPPLMFPRSVSPYVARRKSDDTWSPHHNHLRFYSTPQVGPTHNNYNSSSSSSSSNKTKHGRFSLLSNLFRSRSEKFNPDPPRNSTVASSSSASPSWLSGMFSAGRKKQSAHFSAEYPHRPRRRIDRGMSPARGADSEEDWEEDCDRSPSPSGSGSSSESSQWWKRTPATPASVRRGIGKPGHGKHVSGLAFCLSPLVRASPNRHWNPSQKGGLPPDLGFSGEVRVAVKPHLSTAASFCANRSRKLCDLGRVNHNR